MGRGLTYVPSRAGTAPSIDSVAGASDNALAEPTIGLFKTEMGHGREAVGFEPTVSSLPRRFQNRPPRRTASRADLGQHPSVSREQPSPGHRLTTAGQTVPPFVAREESVGELHKAA